MKKPLPDFYLLYLSCKIFFLFSIFWLSNFSRFFLILCFWCDFLFCFTKLIFYTIFQSLHPTSHHLHLRQNSTQVKKSTGKASVSEKVKAVKKIWSDKKIRIFECCVLKKKHFVITTPPVSSILCEKTKKNSMCERRKKVYLKRQDITKNWLLSPLSAIEYLKNTTQLLIWRLSISLAKHQKIVI